MNEKYHVEVTSRDSAEVEDIALTPPDDDKGTRRIIRPTIVNNVHEAAASVEIELVHQRRHKKNEPWEDADKFSLATLKAGQEVRFDLGATETWRLREALNQLYAIGHDGVPPQSMDFVAIPAQEATSATVAGKSPREVIEGLLAEHEDEVWHALRELQPRRLEVVALEYLHEKRRRIVAIFRDALDNGKGDEARWRKFIADNLWMFGYGFNYQMMNPLEESRDPNRSVTLVNVATPSTELVAPEISDGTHQVSPELAGGVAQLRSHSDSHVVGNTEANRSKSILVIGHTTNLDTVAKRAAFEAFRRSSPDVEILTFDALFTRAELIVDGSKSNNILCCYSQ